MNVLFPVVFFSWTTSVAEDWQDEKNSAEHVSIRAFLKIRGSKTLMKFSDPIMKTLS